MSPGRCTIPSTPIPRPGDPYAFKTIHFDAGPQHMDGSRALEYARSRMSTSDFDRAKRQQLILVAIRDKALNLNLIPKLPTLAATMMDTVKTDMTLDEMVELAALAPQIDMRQYQAGRDRKADGLWLSTPRRWGGRSVAQVGPDQPGGGGSVHSAGVVVPTPMPTQPAPPTPTPTPGPVM